MSAPTHIPVLLEETIGALAVQPGGRYIDCTVGGGGHTAAILRKSSPGGQVLGIDADPEALRAARDRLEPYGNSVLLVNDNFVNLQSICIKYDFLSVHGILFDLGLSSLQLDEKGRGFSFQYESPLDMRFGPGQEITAADIVNTYPLEELERIIREYGEERFSRHIARCIVQERPINSTSRLVDIVEKAVKGKRERIHPATRTFQALRIAVNKELENLESALKQAVNVLGFGGRLVVISYHSLEDRIVKQFMRHESTDCVCPPRVPTCTCGHKASLKLVSRKVITPSWEEVRRNPRSRSARLRAAERVISSDEKYSVIEEIKQWADDSLGWRRPTLVSKLRTTYLAQQHCFEYTGPGGPVCSRKTY